MKEASEGKVNALVTGGNGTLGREIVQCLLEDGGYNVHSLDLLLPEDTNRNTDICQYIQADITNGNDLLVAFKGIDVVFHVAGIIPQLSSTREFINRVNFGGTENVIKASKECNMKRLIYTSSVTVVMSKDPKQILDRVDESYPYPDEPYTAYTCAKGAAERAVRKANGTDGLLTCALRPGGLVSATLIKQVIIYNFSYIDEGANTFPYVPIRAVADSHLLVDKKLSREGKESVAAGSVYNLCLDEGGTQRETNEFIASEVGTRAMSVSSSIVQLFAYINTLVYQLTGLVVVNRYLSPEALQFMKRSYTFSSARAHQELGWPELPPWKEVFAKVTKKCIEEGKKGK